MSLNHLQAIPVDTHVFQIAVTNYMPDLKKTKSITPRIYTEIGDKFRDVYGPLAGWAQTVCLSSEFDLRKNSNGIFFLCFAGPILCGFKEIQRSP